MSRWWMRFTLRAALVLACFTITLVVLASSAGTQIRGEGQLAFVSDRSGLNSQIFLLDIEHGIVVHFARDITGAFNPDWSPDGQSLLFLQPGSPSDLYIVNGDGSGMRRLSEGRFYYSASWSFDGKRVILAEGAGGDLTLRISLHILNIETSKGRTLSDDGRSSTNPDWSPDGKRILFQSAAERNIDLYVIDLQGSHLHRLTDDPATDFSPVWSPDGTRIAFVSNRDGNYEIYRLDMDGASLHRLTNNSAPDYTPKWSPDGEHIAFVSTRSGNFDLYLMDADGGNVRRLTSHPAADQMPVWWP